jgi:hypothetical protein
MSLRTSVTTRYSRTVRPPFGFSALCLSYFLFACTPAVQTTMTTLPDDDSCCRSEPAKRVAVKPTPTQTALTTLPGAEPFPPSAVAIKGIAIDRLYGDLDSTAENALNDAFGRLGYHLAHAYEYKIEDYASIGIEGSVDGFTDQESRSERSKVKAVHLRVRDLATQQIVLRFEQEATSYVSAPRLATVVGAIVDQIKQRYKPQ